jgi:hypothetical protein
MSAVALMRAGLLVCIVVTSTFTVVSTWIETANISSSLPAPYRGAGEFFGTYAALLALALVCRRRLLLSLTVLAGVWFVRLLSLGHWQFVADTVAAGGTKDSQAGIGIAWGPVVSIVAAAVTGMAVAVLAIVQWGIGRLIQRGVDQRRTPFAAAPVRDDVVQ